MRWLFLLLADNDALHRKSDRVLLLVPLVKETEIAPAALAVAGCQSCPLAVNRSSPLIFATDLRNLSAEKRSIVANAEVERCSFDVNSVIADRAWWVSAIWLLRWASSRSSRSTRTRCGRQASAWRTTLLAACPRKSGESRCSTRTGRCARNFACSVSLAAIWPDAVSGITLLCLPCFASARWPAIFR
jgi:hypothetical protein